MKNNGLPFQKPEAKNTGTERSHFHSAIFRIKSPNYTDTVDRDSVVGHATEDMLKVNSSFGSRYFNTFFSFLLIITIESQQ